MSGLVELERIRTAYHEAGHVVVADVLGFEVVYASIVPEGTSEGRCQTGPGDDPTDEICVLIAGGIAEESSPAGARPGLDGCDSLRLDRLLDRFWPDPIGQYRLWQELDGRTRELVAQQWPAIERVAALLLEREEITGDLVTRERVAIPPMQGGTIGSGKDGKGAQEAKRPTQITTGQGVIVL